MYVELQFCLQNLHFAKNKQMKTLYTNVTPNHNTPYL